MRGVVSSNEKYFEEDEVDEDLDIQALEETIEQVREGGKKDILKNGEKISVFVEKIDPIRVTDSNGW